MSYEAAMNAALGLMAAPDQKSPYADIMATLVPDAGLPPLPQGAAAGASGRSAVMDTGNAVGTGFFRGLARLAGLPVDTAANVIDLGKAAAGSGYIAATGKSPPSWLEVGSRADVPFSGENLVRNIGKTSPGNLMINPANPEYEGGYAQAAGAGLNAVIAPASGWQAANQAAIGATSSMAAKAAYEATGDPAWAVIAGLTPAGVQQGVVAGTKYFVRGGEQGRKDMEQRVQDLRNAGIQNPTLGLASGNKVIGGMENILQSTPGAVKVMSRARDEAINGLRAKTDEAANLASTNRGASEAGSAIQSGIRDFKDAYKGRQEVLYDRVGNTLPPQFPADIGRTKETLSRLNSDIPGAPELSKQFRNERIRSIEDAILKDSGVTPSGSTRVINEAVVGRVQPVGTDLMGRPVYRGDQRGVSSQPGATIMRPGATRPDMMGRPVQLTPDTPISIPGQQVPIFGSVPMRSDGFGGSMPVPPVVGQRTTVIPPTNTGPFSGLGVTPKTADSLPFEAVKKLRTLVGNEIADASLISNVPQSKWRSLYGGLSDDLGSTARRAGPEAEKAFTRATDYTRAGAQRLERVAPFAQAVAPEQAYTAMVNASRENVSTLQAVKKVLPPDARGQVAGTIIERLGKATNSQQNDTSTAWSPETFLSNWNRMAPKARDELFSGFKNSPEVRAQVDAVAKATSMMRESSKMWANPSGTGANLAARGMLGAVGVGGATSAVGLLNPYVPASVAGGMLGANLLARGLTRPGTIEAMLRRNVVSPGLLGTQAVPLLSGGLLNQ